MASKALLVVLPVIFLVGASFGHNNSPEPKIVTRTEVKIVQVPEVVTHIETKTVTIHAPLPESCKLAIDILANIKPIDSTIAASTGIASDEIGKANLAVALHDILAANKSIQKLTTVKVELDLAIVSKSAMAIELQTHVENCLKEATP